MNTNINNDDNQDTIMVKTYWQAVHGFAAEPDPRALAAFRPDQHERVTRLLAEQRENLLTVSAVDTTLTAIALIEALSVGDRDRAEALRAAVVHDEWLVWALADVGALAIVNCPDRDELLAGLRLKALTPDDQ